jgi:ribose 5-phosphate isomerase RpiB
VQKKEAVLLFVVATNSYGYGTFVRVNKNKNVWAIQVNFVVHAERANDVPNCRVNLRSMDLIVETAVEDNAVTKK